MISKYTKKPIVIKALKFEYSENGIAELSKFCGSVLGSYGRDEYSVGWAHIRTPEDSADTIKHKSVATEGDYIIKDIYGKFYPCKPDLFNLTYEKV